MASRAADRTVLIADIGGTNARFALLGEEARPRGLATLATRDYGSATEAVRAYLRVHAGGLNPQEAAIAAAGPVIDGRVHMTNAPWSIDAEDLRSGLGIERVALLNDFEALAWSLPALSEEQLVPVGGGAGLSSAPSAVIGPGTGFGVAALVTAGTVETVLVTEGGHATMPCATKREEAIVDMVRADHGHVSIERLLSGDGLVSLYNAIVRLDLLKAPPGAAPRLCRMPWPGTARRAFIRWRRSARCWAASPATSRSRLARVAGFISAAELCRAFARFWPCRLSAIVSRRRAA